MSSLNGNGDGYGDGYGNGDGYGYGYGDGYGNGYPEQEISARNVAVQSVARDHGLLPLSDLLELALGGVR